MTILAIIIFYISAYIIFWAMIGYPLSLKFIARKYNNRHLEKDYSHQPSVTVMVVAHNEEKVIEQKLNNLLDLDYPKDKLEILVASDNSTDNTNAIVRKFIEEHKDVRIRLYEVKERKGKTNAQNEAHKTVATEYLVMTDANPMLDKNAVKELMAAFVSDDIAYVTGKLVIINKDISDISASESGYWDRDLKYREIESKIQTITAGNGALYACRTKDYYDFPPIQCHDSAMPLHYALLGKRAICNHDAIAYEKAGEVVEDEFKRKVRLNRRILEKILPTVKLLNIFKYKWFTYFYFGHRTCRYLLWVAHLLLLLSNMVLVGRSPFYTVTLIGQIVFYLIALLKQILKINHKAINMAYYYCITIIAQWVGVFNIVTGKAKPVWEKAESTR